MKFGILGNPASTCIVGFAVSAFAGYLLAQGPVSVRIQPYGDMKIKGGVFGATVNGKSTLPRQAVIVNDAWCPLEITNAQLIPEPNGTDNFLYRVSGTVRSTKQTTVTAFELNFVLYDPLGNKIKDLYFPFVQDMKPGDTLNLSETYSYSGWLGDAKRAHSIFFWIGAVRLQDSSGQAVWQPDNATVQARVKATHDSLYAGSHREIK